MVTNYPRYFQNHPNCVRSTTCNYLFGQCSAAPSPTDADR
jgi:hypothetical protein